MVFEILYILKENMGQTGFLPRKEEKICKQYIQFFLLKRVTVFWLEYSGTSNNIS